MADMTVNIPGRDDNPKWLGDLQIESDDTQVHFIALSAKGQEKYRWSAPIEDMSKAMDLLGV
jgi:hypothetical protein